MNHPGEIAIELYVLGSPTSETERAQLTAHMDECSPCGRMHDTIREFYRELEAEPGPADQPAGKLPVPHKRTTPAPAPRSMSPERPGHQMARLREVESAYPIRSIHKVRRD